MYVLQFHVLHLFHCTYEGWGEHPGYIIVPWLFVSARVSYLSMENLGVFDPNLPPEIPEFFRTFPSFSSCSCEWCFCFLHALSPPSDPLLQNAHWNRPKNSFQIISPSSQSPPESPHHQWLSWVMHGMEAHTVCSRHCNHGNTPDVSWSLGGSEEKVDGATLPRLPLLPQARSL